MNIEWGYKSTGITDLENPDFEHPDRIQDWKNYVPDEWQKDWKKFSERERQIIAIMAQSHADKEYWS